MKISVAGCAFIACILAILLIVALKQYSNFVYRLVLYLMIAALLQALTHILEVLPVRDNDNQVIVPSKWTGICSVFAFLSQVATWMEYLIIWWVLAYLLVLTLFKYKANTRKHEIIGLIIVLVLPIAINWIPFVGGKYGLSGLWCWIKVTAYHSFKGHCRVSVIGITYMVVFLYGPLILLMLFSFVAFLIIIAVLCRLQKKMGLSRQGIQEALPLLAYPIIYNLIFAVLVVNRIYDAVLVDQRKSPYYPLWVAHAVADPAQALFLPLAFMLHPSTLKKLFNRRRKRDLQDTSATAFIVSKQSVDPELDPLVIKGTNRQAISTTPNYYSIFEGSEKSAE